MSNNIPPSGEAPPHCDGQDLSDGQVSGAADMPKSPSCYPASLYDSCFDPERGDMSLEAEAAYPPSLHTDHSSSTLSASTVKHPHHIKNSLLDQLDTYMYRLDHPVTSVQEHRLTEEALRAFNVDNANHGYNRDLSGWCLDGTLFVGDVAERNQLSDSMMVMSHQTKSRVTETTSSSWSKFSTKSYCDHIAEHVSGAGGKFVDDAAAPQTLEDDIVMV